MENGEAVVVKWVVMVVGVEEVVVIIKNYSNAIFKFYLNFLKGHRMKMGGYG